MKLLCNTLHANAVKTMDGEAFWFVEGSNKVLSNSFDLDTIFGCPAKRVGAIQRAKTLNESELDWHARYAEPLPKEILAIYEVDWTEFEGSPIAGTGLLEGGCVSSNNLSDATIWMFAVDRQANCVVDYDSTSYWRSDRNSRSNWLRHLVQNFPAKGLQKQLASA